MFVRPTASIMFIRRSAGEPKKLGVTVTLQWRWLNCYRQPSGATESAAVELRTLHVHKNVPYCVLYYKVRRGLFFRLLFCAFRSIRTSIFSFHSPGHNWLETKGITLS